MKKCTFIILLFAALCGSLFAQKPTDVLATATGHKFTLKDLSPEFQEQFAQLPTAVQTARKAILEELINVRVVSLEAAAQGVTSGKLIVLEKAKVAAPTEAEIKALYDANRAAFGEATLEQMRDRIVAYLRTEPESKAVQTLLVSLRTKYKAATAKDINAAALPAADVVANVGGKAITAAEFEKFAAIELYELNGQMADMLLGELDDAIFSALAADEAKSLGIDPSELIAREITNKLKDFTDAERATVSAAFGKRLNEKYNVKLLYKEPEQPVEDVSVDDDPSQGPATAPVTVIMFSDFQCSACSGTHPLLKEAIAANAGKVRLVVRDFPLELLHKDSLAAARAAAAANAQGKFFEYIDVLYKNQSAQDDASLRKYAADLGLNAAQFDIDFKSEKVLAEIKKDIADGEAINISSTPTIFVNGRRVYNLSLEGFKAAITRALAK